MNRDAANYLRVAIAYYNEAQPDKTKYLKWDDVIKSIADQKSFDCIVDTAQDIHAMTEALNK
jgi:hypothetical protein